MRARAAFVLGTALVACRGAEPPLIARAFHLRFMATVEPGVAPSSPPASNPGALVVRRSPPGEAWFEVTLGGTPVGGVLALTCAWIDPAGRVARENAWETRPIAHDDWPTHCRMAVDANTPPGRWSVSMAREGEILASTRFEVE